MPDKLDEYFRGRYRQEKQELKRLDQLIGRVFPTFRDCRLGGSWPYELAESQPIEFGESYSFSTNSMVLYAICSAHGYLGYDTFGPDESLIPVRHPVVFDSDELQDAVTGVINAAREASDALQEPNAEAEGQEVNPPAEDADQDEEGGVAGVQEITFRSSSFGQDDPLTLSWFISVVVGLKKHAPSIVDPLLDNEGARPFWHRTIRSAASTIRRLFNDEELLLFVGGDGNDPVDHAFIRLKTVHLAEVLRSSLPELPSIVGEGGQDVIDDAIDAIQNYNGRLSTLRQFFLDRLYQHLAHDSVRDGPFDAAELVFSLEGTLLCHPNRAFFDSDLIDRVFEVIDRRQQNNPYWRPLKPFLITPQGFALLPLSVEIANSLLRICDLIHDDERPVSYFSQHLGLFGRYTEWLQTRSSQGRRRKGESSLVGTRSTHFNPGRSTPGKQVKSLYF